ncbi:MAG: hypothetical protein AAB547_02200 [Patescibacteria group bacterium]
MSQVSQPITDHHYYPLLFVGAEETGSVSAVAQIWATYKALPQEKKNILLSDELPKKIKVLQDTFRLNSEAIGHITLLIRKIFFGELSLPECEAKIGSMLMQVSGGDPNQARAITEFIRREILTIQPTPETEEKQEEAKAVTVNMPLLQALSKYENLGNQLITEDRIRIKSQPEPVRPSLLYWLKYYRDELGVGHHDNVQRGGLLFRSENGKKLSAQERERINLILKSVEENFPLAIDAERQEIIFPAFQGVLMGDRPPRLGEAGSEPPAVSQHARAVQNTAFFVPEKAKENAHTEYVSGGPARSLPKAGSVSGELRIGRSAPSSVATGRAPRSAEIGSVNFSTTHVFPAEREAAEHRTLSPKPAPQVMPPAPRPTPQPTFQPAPTPAPAPRPAPKPAAPQPNPFHIHPVSLGGKE